MHCFAETLGKIRTRILMALEVQPSIENPAVRLYPGLLRGRNRYICLVVKWENSYSCHPHLLSRP